MNVKLTDAFIKGIKPAEKTKSYSFYGVESVIVSIPNGMAKEFGIDTADTGKEFMPSKKFETFITNQWNDITKLCKLEKLK